MKASKDPEKTAKIVRWLAEHGSPVVVPKIKSTLKVEQLPGDNITRVLDLDDGRAGYILDLSITNLSSKPGYITHSQFQMTWSDSTFAWMEDPRQSAGHPNSYCLLRSVEYPRDLVLNHVLFSGGSLKPYASYAGLLLGIGDPMPSEIVHGFSFKGTLTLAINGGTPVSSEIQIRAERLMKTRHTLHTRPPKFEGLYGTKIRNGAPADADRSKFGGAQLRQTVRDAVDPDSATKRRQ